MKKLNKENRAHINNVLRFVNEKLPPKFARGVTEHGGGLWKKNVGPEIESELLDLIVYVYTREEQVKRLVAAAQAMSDHDWFECIHLKELNAALAPFLQKPEK